MQAGKGLLAMDESNPTCNKRFAKLGIPQTEEARRAWRELILSTPGLGEFISGAILYDETIRQSKNDGTPFVKLLTEAGIVPGIKVDTGAKDLAGHPGEKITEGLDGLRERLSEYRQMGARFAKWRAVITIGEGIPSCGCLEANAHALARYAALCQEAGLVPIVEPEVLMDGDHTLEQCARTTEAALHTVFSQLYRQRVLLEGMILKPNMVLPGKDCPTQASVDEVADATVILSPPGGAGGGPRRRLPVRGAECRVGLGPLECHESQVAVQEALGSDLFLFPGYSATGPGHLERGGNQQGCSPKSPVSPGSVQQYGAPGGVSPGDGEILTLFREVFLTN